MSLVKPNIVAEALGITTDALRKRRSRGTTKSSKLSSSSNMEVLSTSNLVPSENEPIDYIVTGTGRVMYETTLLDPSVRSNVEKITTKRTKLAHEERMRKDFRYANSLGKVNERKKRIHQQEVDRRAKEVLEREKIAQLKLQEQRSGVRGPRSEKQYAKWVNPYDWGNYWSSIEDYENSKKKKTFKGYY
jgi:hypothetical protein|tara:strand:- start:532 stop:1098 length:567 start_codon:yes stop_codon:yes gene_type:complete